MPLQSANLPELITLFEWVGTGQGNGGLNQSAGRSVIDDQELWWLENFFPVAPGELRSGWGPSAPLYTAPAGVTILRIFFACIDSINPLGFMFLSDGTVTEVNLNTLVARSMGQIWQPIAPNYWADVKLWAPNQFGNTPGQTGGLLIGSPAGLYAFDGNAIYAPGSTPPLWLTGGATTDSSGNPLVMPVGLPGIYAMEVYLQRLFVMGQTVISMSAPSNGADFSTGSGGGSWGYQGDQLTVSYTDMAASFGFLYVFGDSMVNFVSGLQLVGSQLGGAAGTISIYTTQFNYANINPQIGQKFFRPVGHWLQDLIVFDGAGMFDLNNQSMIWISPKITNLVNTVNTSAITPTITPAHVFGQRWLMVNGQFTDPWGVSRSMLLCWNGSIWMVCSQNLNLTHIGSYEQNSTITPYGTDGRSLYQLFAQPDNTLMKRLATKAYSAKHILVINDWKRAYVEMKDNMSPPGPEGVYIFGTYTAAEGGVPGGSQGVSFSIPPGTKDTVPHPTEGKGLKAWLDLASFSPDFTIARISLTYDERSLYGA